MNRRSAIARSLGILAWSLTGPAHADRNAARVAVLSPGAPPASASPLFEAFRSGLRDFGYVEGRNLTLEWRFADGVMERLPQLASELVQVRPDVIVTVNTPDAEAARQATRTIPILFVQVADTAASHVVDSLARPGGNITGLVSISGELSGKRLELLKEALPRASRLAVLLQPTAAADIIFRELDAAGRKLGLRVTRVAVRDPDEVEPAIVDAARHGIAAIVVIDSATFAPLRAPTLAAATKHHLPVISQFREVTDAGGLMAYGPSLAELYRRAAQYVDQILRGVKPGDLPVEQPTKYELIVNLKAAKTLGITIPRSVLLRADEVIE